MEKQKVFLNQLNKEYVNQHDREGLDVSVESKEKDNLYERKKLYFAKVLMNDHNSTEKVRTDSIPLQPLQNPKIVMGNIVAQIDDKKV